MINPTRSASARLWTRSFVLGGFVAAVLACQASVARAQVDWSSSDPVDRLPPRPYFILMVDTSSSMNGCINPVNPFPNSCPASATPNSCGYEPTRINDVKCALMQTVLAYSGQANFGLATFPVVLSGCSEGPCSDSCAADNGVCSPPTAIGTSGEFYQGSGCSVSPFQDWQDHETCGNEPDCDSGAPPSDPPEPPWPENWENSANIVVDVIQDTTTGAAPISNAAELLKWFDGQCDESKELFAIGATPIAGALRTAHQYYAYGWSSAWNDANYCAVGGPTLDHPTPIDSVNDSPNRSLNVILVADGNHTSLCQGDPTAAAADLFNSGVIIDGQQVPIKTHVIAFADADPSGSLADIADMGDDGSLNGSTASALPAADEASLAQALARIISDAQPLIFYDSFESGTTSLWSSSVP